MSQSSMPMDTTGMSAASNLQQLEATTTSAIGSGLTQQKVNFKPILEPKSSQLQFQTPNTSQMPIYRLLQPFKLQSYVKSFLENGYSEDVYKLTMITHRKKQELIDSMNVLPAHRQRFTDLFKRIDHLYPKQSVSKTLDNAIRASSRQSNNNSGLKGTQPPPGDTLITAMNIPEYGTARMSIQTAQSSAETTMVQGVLPTHITSLLHTQPVELSNQNVVNASATKQCESIVERGRSPPSQSKNQRSTNLANNNLIGKFDGLDRGTRAAINDSFLQNMRSAKAKVTTVQEALKEFYGKDSKAKQSVIDKIFAQNAPIQVDKSSQQRGTSKGSNGQKGGNFAIGLSKYVKVQMGSAAQLASIRQQINSQEGAKQIPGRRSLDKRNKNNVNSDNSGSPEPVLLVGQAYRKGSHPPPVQAQRQKNQANNSQSRIQLQMQARQQRLTSHSRIQISQNSNFMIAPGSTRAAVAGKQGSSSKKNREKQQQHMLQRVNSASGCKNMAQQNSNDYAAAIGTAHSQQRGQNQSQMITAGQQAAIKRIQMHRQKSAQKNLLSVEMTSASKMKPPTASNQSIIMHGGNQSSSGTRSRVQRRNISRDCRQPASQRHQHLDTSANQSLSKPTETSLNETGKTTEADTTRLHDEIQKITSTTKEAVSRLNLVKRASSQGASNRDSAAQLKSRRSLESHENVASSRHNGGGVGAPVSQTNVFTEFKIITSPELDMDPTNSRINLPPITVTNTVQKVQNLKQKELAENTPIKSTNAVHPASAAGKPPMSTSKRSGISSKIQSVKTIQSVHQSPSPATKDTGNVLKAPLILEPIEKSTTIEPKEEDKSDSKVIEPSEIPPYSPPQQQIKSQLETETHLKHEQDNVKWTPLLEKTEKMTAKDYGFSFGSKKVAMGPGFMNLRFMCHCLARAIKKHLEFSRGEHWFLQDLQKEQDDIDLEFSYQLPADLRLTLNPRGEKVGEEDDDDDEDINPFQRVDSSPARDIAAADIQVSAESAKVKKSLPDSEPHTRTVTSIAEPEPEIIQSLDSDKKFSNVNQNNNPEGQAAGEDEIGEDIDEFSQNHCAEDPEEQSINEIRRDEARKNVQQKDEMRLTEYLNERKRVNELEMKLKNKDKQIAHLTRIVQNSTVRSEIMSLQPFHDSLAQQEDEDQGFFDRGVKMDRAEWLMAQVDLDPIESHGSMEMSTTKFKSLHGKRFINSELGANGTVNNALDDSRTSINTRLPSQAEPIKSKKKSTKSYESAFVDVSEDKMREFAITQLRHFDVRMEYDSMQFDEGKFTAMPSEKYIADYCKYVTIACKMENEIPIVCLVYLEKLLLTTGILLNKYNWRRTVLVCLCLASKIWDDDSLENVHFPKVMSDVTNLEINKLEQLFLEFIDYKLVIKGAEYAKYYFILRSMAEDIHKEQSASVAAIISPFENTRRNKDAKEEWGEFPLRAPISAEKMLELQRQEAKAEVYLKERHEREFITAYIGHKAGSRKDNTRHQQLLLDRTM